MKGYKNEVIELVKSRPEGVKIREILILTNSEHGSSKHIAILEELDENPNLELGLDWKIRFNQNPKPYFGPLF